MLHIAGKDLFPERSEILSRYDFSDENLRRDFEISGGDWRMEDGMLTGRQKEDGGALIYSKRVFPDNILLDFTCCSVPPCVNDLNFTWRAEGWDYEKNDALRAYIAGLGGWWDGKAGIEKYPGSLPWAATPLFRVEAGRTYHIQAGDIDGHCFLFVDGSLIVELTDPNPETLAGLGRVGLGVYASAVRFGSLVVMKTAWERHDQAYN